MSTAQDEQGSSDNRVVPQTPAPSHTGSGIAPDAPGPRLPAQELPTSTPLATSTPVVNKHTDISEFDPFATPAPRNDASGIAGPSSTTPSQNTPATSSEAKASEGEEPFNFSGFLKDLRVKSAEPVARYLKRWAKRDVAS